MEENRLISTIFSNQKISSGGSPLLLAFFVGFLDGRAGRKTNFYNFASKRPEKESSKDNDVKNIEKISV